MISYHRFQYLNTENCGYKKRGNVNGCRTVLVKNLIKEIFYRKRKKKQLMF